MIENASLFSSTATPTLQLSHSFFHSANMSSLPRLPSTANVEIAAPGTPASPVIYNSEVFVQGTKYGVSMPSSIISSSNYVTPTSVSSSSGVSYPSYSSGRYVCCVVAPSTLTELLECNCNVVYLKQWQYVTHVIYQGLNVTPAGKVCVEGDGLQCKVLG